MTAKVTKSKAQPKRTIEQANDDHPLGLWIDRELIRKHTQHQPKKIQTPSTMAGHRYLELADVALGQKLHYTDRRKRDVGHHPERRKPNLGASRRAKKK